MEKVPSLETCKRLKEAGWKVETDKVWLKPDKDWILEDFEHWQVIDSEWGNCRDLFYPWQKCDESENCDKFHVHDVFTAPDVTELLEALPADVDAYKTSTKYEAGYRESNSPRLFTSADTPAEALALLWLELHHKD